MLISQLKPMRDYVSKNTPEEVPRLNVLAHTGAPPQEHAHMYT